MRIENPQCSNLARLYSSPRHASRLVFAVIRRTAHQHEMPVAIATVDITLFINLKPDAGMSQRGGDIAAAVTGNARFADSNGFGVVFVHDWRLAKLLLRRNGSEIFERDCPCAGIFPRRLIGSDFKCRAYWKHKDTVRGTYAKA